MKATLILCSVCLAGLVGCMTAFQSAGPQGTGQAKESDSSTSRGGKYIEEPLGENTFRIDIIGGAPSDYDRIRTASLVRAARIALSAGYAYFRILDSWEQWYGQLSFVKEYYRSITIRPTNDPNDIDAQWVVDRLGP